jgi:threonylcarbamoyladenosine tRNA methylthiotransferase MtaB
VEAGAREIVLTGINLGRYRDETADTDLAGLVSAVADTGVPRLRLSSIEPRDLTERFLEVAASTPAFCPHLHVPLQSGSDDVLAAMSREYSAGEYLALVRAAAEAIPGLALTTDVIAGFPGETEADAAKTLAFCEEVGFRRMHVFRYSARSGTPAAELRDQVAPSARAARATALRDLSARLWERSACAVLGEERELLVEHIEASAAGGLVAEGTTPDYLRVRVELPPLAAPSRRAGELLRVRLVSAAGERVDGVPAEPLRVAAADAGAGFARTPA